MQIFPLSLALSLRRHHVHFGIVKKYALLLSLPARETRMLFFLDTTTNVLVAQIETEKHSSLSPSWRSARCPTVSGFVPTSLLFCEGNNIRTPATAHLFPSSAGPVNNNKNNKTWSLISSLGKQCIPQWLLILICAAFLFIGILSSTFQKPINALSFLPSGERVNKLTSRSND